MSDKCGRIVIRPGEAFENYEIFFAPTLATLGVGVSMWIAEHPQLAVVELAILIRNADSGPHAMAMVVFFRALETAAKA